MQLAMPNLSHHQEQSLLVLSSYQKPIEKEARIEIELHLCCSRSRRNTRLKEEEKKDLWHVLMEAQH
jgi:hypothetical protein